MIERISEDALFFSKTKQFLNVYLPCQAVKSKHTRKQYKTGLAQFYDYVNKTLHISPLAFTSASCTYSLLLGYMQNLKEVRKLHPATVNVRMVAIREYLRYVSDDNVDWIPAYIAACKVPTITVPKVQRPTLSKKDIMLFLNSPGENRFGKRDRFILILLFDTAIRVEELISITLGDVVQTDSSFSILIHGKGRKERCVELSDRARKQAEVYLKCFHNNQNNPKMPLIYTRSHGEVHPMSIRNVERIINKYGCVSKRSSDSIPDSIYPHLLRRTRATTLYQDGVALELISAMLGHSNIETTRSHYAFPSDEQKKEMMNRATETEPDEVREWEGNEDEIKRKFGLA